MPIVIPKSLPAFKILTEENIFIMPKNRADSQDIRPIEIAIVNLMPTKIETETQLMRLLSNTPLQVNVTLIKTDSYKSTNVDDSHLEKFYKTFDEVSDKHFDGMIITGAPVETLPYSEVKYWDELCRIMDYADEFVTSTIFICWGAQAGLKYHYDINKVELASKLFGVFKNRAVQKNEMILKGLNDTFSIPHSRHTTIPDDVLFENENIEVLASGKGCGVSICKSKDNKKFFFFGHSEYGRDTLKNEYLRDLSKGLKIEQPHGYFIDGDIEKIDMSWNSTGNLLFYNWLNYYVYQVTPFNLNTEKSNQ